MFKRLGNRAFLRLHLFKQPYVLDRDDGLIGKGRNQFDLLVGKWSHCTTPQQNHSNWISFAHEGHAKSSPKAGFLRSFSHRVFCVRKNVSHVNCLAKENCSSDYAPPAWLMRDVLKIVVQFWWVAIGRSVIKGLPFLTRNGSDIRLAKPRSRLG